MYKFILILLSLILCEAKATSTKTEVIEEKALLPQPSKGPVILPPEYEKIIRTTLQDAQEFIEFAQDNPEALKKKLLEDPSQLVDKIQKIAQTGQEKAREIRLIKKLEVTSCMQNCLSNPCCNSCWKGTKKAGRISCLTCKATFDILKFSLEIGLLRTLTNPSKDLQVAPLVWNLIIQGDGLKILSRLSEVVQNYVKDVKGVIDTNEEIPLK